MRVVVTGATGLIGSALVPFLESGGDATVALRRGSGATSDTPSWDPATGEFSAGAVAGIRREPLEKVAADTWANAVRFFGLPEAHPEVDLKVRQAANRLAADDASRRRSSTWCWSRHSDLCCWC